MDDGPWLVGAVRGAWGRRLYELASTPTSGWGIGELPAVEVLLEQHGQVTSRLPVPKPYVFSIDIGPRLITTRLTLFGFAGFWRPAATEALRAAFEGGIALSPESRLRVPVKVIDSSWSRHEAVDEAPLESGAALFFRTPISVRQGHAVQTDLSEILFGIASRVAALARWQDMAVSTDWYHLRGLTLALNYDGSGLRPWAWQRNSRRVPGRPIPMTGLLGRLVILGDLTPFSAILSLGATCHAGGQTTLGLGRFELVPWYD